MILVHRLNKFCIENYKKDFEECVKHNLNTGFFNKAVVFAPIGFEINDNRIKFFIDKNLSEYEIIEKTKLVCKNDVYVYGNPFIKFNKSLNFLESQRPMSIGSDCFIIDSKINLKKINKNIEYCFYQPVINSKLSFIERKHFWTDEMRTSEKLVRTEQLLKVEVDTTSQNVVRVKGQKIQSKINKIDVIIVSVNYNDYLLVTLRNNLKQCENITVVTSAKDEMCIKICEQLGVKVITTEKMYENGAPFNKGKAVNVGISSIIDPDWILILDADICLPKDFNEKISDLLIDKASLITTKRSICKNYEDYLNWKNNKFETENEKEEQKGLGYFQMFHSSKFEDNKPYSEKFNNASDSDICFRNSFFNNIISLDLEVLHLGEVRKNWYGRRSESFITETQFDDLLRRSRNKKNSKNKTFNDLMSEVFLINKNNLEVPKVKKSKKPYIFHVSQNLQTDKRELIKITKSVEKNWKKIYSMYPVIPVKVSHTENLKDIINEGIKLCDEEDIVMFTLPDTFITENVYKKITEKISEFGCCISIPKEISENIEGELSVSKVKKLKNTADLNKLGLFAVTKDWWENFKSSIKEEKITENKNWIRNLLEVMVTSSGEQLAIVERSNKFEISNISYRTKIEKVLNY